jgi:hypothetical protein
MLDLAEIDMETFTRFSDEARKAYSEAESGFESLVESNPKVNTFHADFASLLEGLIERGCSEFKADELEQAELFYQHAREVSAKLLSHHPEQNVYREVLAASLFRIAECLDVRKERDAGRDSAQQALDH